MKRWFLSLILLAAGLCIALLLAEGIVRVAAPYSRDHVVPPGMFDIDPDLGWKLHAGKTAHHRTRYFDVEYRIDERGYRSGPEHPASAGPVRRLLSFGDSQVFGWGVPPDSTFSAALMRMIPGMEASNMAVPGYGFDQQILAYERQGQSAEVTDVLFYASTATLARMGYRFLYRKPKPAFGFDSAGGLVKLPIEQKSSRFTDGMYRALSRFYLPYFLEAQLIRIARPNTVRLGASGPPKPETLRLVKAVLAHADKVATARNHRIILLASLPDQAAAELKTFCETNGIVFASTPWPAAPQNLVFGKHDLHWTPRAHALVAERLTRALLTGPPIDETAHENRSSLRAHPEGREVDQLAR